MRSLLFQLVWIKTKSEWYTLPRPGHIPDNRHRAILENEEIKEGDIYISLSANCISHASTDFSTMRFSLLNKEGVGKCNTENDLRTSPHTKVGTSCKHNQKKKSWDHECCCWDDFKTFFSLPFSYINDSFQSLDKAYREWFQQHLY